MRTKTITVTDVDGRQHAMAAREMTLGEIRDYNAGATYEQHLLAVCKPQADLIPRLPFSEARRLSLEIGELTFGSEDEAKNSESTGGPSSIPAAASTVIPAGT